MYTYNTSQYFRIQIQELHKMQNASHLLQKEASQKENICKHLWHNIKFYKYI